MTIRLASGAGAELDVDGLASLYARPHTQERPQPWVRVNFVSTLDGSAVGPDGLSGSLSSASDREVFGVLRRLTDAVLVAAGTVRAEGYAGALVDQAQSDWRGAHGRAEHPDFLIVSRSLDIDPATLDASPVRPVVITTRDAPADAARSLAPYATVVACGERDVDVAELRAWLERAGYRDVLCGGGPSLLGALVAADGLDELCLTLAPQLVAGQGPRIAVGSPAERGMSLEHVLRGDAGDLHLRYTRTR